MAIIKPLSSNDIDIKVLNAPGTVILDFYQASCGPCRTLEPCLERVARQYEGKVPVYRLDIDLDLPMAKRFGVTSIPTLLVMRGGKEIDRLDGLITDGELKAAFERATLHGCAETRTY